MNFQKNHDSNKMSGSFTLPKSEVPSLPKLNIKGFKLLKVKKTTKINIPKGSTKLNVSKKHMNKKDIKKESNIEFIKRFLKLTPKQARPLKVITRDDKIFKSEKSSSRTNKYFIDDVSVTKSVFTRELKKQFSEWKNLWREKSIRLQRVPERLERRRLLSDSDFRISSRYSNKIDDRIRTINKVKFKKEEYENRWKEYLKELELREENEEYNDNDLHILINMFEELIKYAKEYIEKNGVVNYGIRERVYTLRNLYVDREILNECEEYVKTLGEMGIQIKVLNLVTKKVMMLSFQNFDDYLFSVNADGEQSSEHIVFKSGSDAFNIFDEDDIKASDYEFSLLPIAPERRRFKTRKEYDDFKKLQKKRRDEYYN